MYKHVKQVHRNEEQGDKEFTVGCGLCFMEFNSEEACDAHDCAAKKASKGVVKKEPKSEVTDEDASVVKRQMRNSRASKK